MHGNYDKLYCFQKHARVSIRILDFQLLLRCISYLNNRTACGCIYIIMEPQLVIEAAKKIFTARGRQKRVIDDPLASRALCYKCLEVVLVNIVL